jgi:hypothetical protein
MPTMNNNAPAMADAISTREKNDAFTLQTIDLGELSDLLEVAQTEETVDLGLAIVHRIVVDGRRKILVNAASGDKSVMIDLSAA